MNQKQTLKRPGAPLPAKSLTQVLKDSEHVGGMIKESAAELASVNSVLNDNLSNGKQLPGVEKALEKSEAVELKVQEASEKLAQVNLSLERGVHERQRLEQDLADIGEHHKQSLHSSLHDALTGLPNRVLFYDRLEHGMEQAKRHGWSLSVMFLDIDKFKSINDSHGHAVGDAILLTIAKRLAETTRTDDTISRHGGDEFLYLLMEMGEEKDAAIVAKKILQAVQIPCVVGDTRIEVNTSIGIAIYPQDGSSVEALIHSADAAMYRAKQSRSGYAFANGNPPLPSNPPAALAQP
ncbi:GGDEF domain-containing protein [Rhodoferax sp. GW822-FHT02A01]|uniref:GGDEF domain-containing protein n=1 Tax=Rhodoferax sp. GW822-FHT02A01 TaxID=3141537 RepID=UPI00315CAD82